MLPSSLNNPVLEEVDNISPEAKQALIGAHQHAISQMGVLPPETQPTPGSGPPAPTPATQPTPAPSLGAPMSPGLAHSTPTPVAQPTTQGLADRGELNRLTAVSTPGLHDQTQTGLSGIGQIHNPWARIPLQIADAIGQGFAPGIESALPGTQGQHQLLVQRAKARVGEDESLLNNEQKRGLEAAQTTAAASTPEFRQGEVANTAQKNAVALQTLTAKHQNLVTQTNQRLAKDGYILDADSGVERPMKPEEMSDPAQAKMALNRAQADYEGAEKEYKEAQTKNIPQAMQVAQQKMELTRQHLALAAQGLSMRVAEYNMHAKGTDINGNPLPGALQTDTGQTVGSVNAGNVRPTGAERTKADLAKSVDFQIRTMKDIIARRGDEYFGPANGRKNNLQQAIGNNDPEALQFKAAADFLGDHAAGMFGSRSQGVINATKDLFNPRFEPKSLLAALDQAQQTSNEFKDSGTVHVIGGKNEIKTTIPVKVSTKAERDALAPGTVYIGPDGNQATKH